MIELVNYFTRFKNNTRLYTQLHSHFQSRSQHLPKIKASIIRILLIFKRNWLKSQMGKINWTKMSIQISVRISHFRVMTCFWNRFDNKIKKMYNLLNILISQLFLMMLMLKKANLIKLMLVKRFGMRILKILKLWK